jgi:hypothetical protein
MLLGSRAVAFWNEQMKIKEFSDWDILGDSIEVSEWGEQHNPNGYLDFHSLYVMNNGDIPYLFGSGVYHKGLEVCSPVGLMLLYRSHLWRDLKFDSNITLYHKFILPVAQGYLYGRREQDWFKQRVQMTKEEFPQGNPSLSQANDDFFDDAVQKVYDHDWLHEQVAFYDRPMYERLKYATKKDLAWCEKKLWDKLEPWEKDICVAEETYVIATERFLVPNQWTTAPKLAYFKALRKVCTTLTSGWFRDWAIDNYPRIVELYSTERFDKLKEKLND